MQCNDKKIVDELRKEIQQKLDGKVESLLAIGLSAFLLTEHLRICDSHGPDVAKRVMDMKQRERKDILKYIYHNQPCSEEDIKKHFLSNITEGKP